MAGEPAAALLGVFPAQWQAWDEAVREARLRDHVLGRRLLVSLYMEEGKSLLQVAGVRHINL